MYKCEFPGCVGYETEHRSQIHYHHIIPRECGGSNLSKNLIPVCPNCHSRIFIEGTHGIHSVNGNDSIVINRWMKSTAGRVLEYKDNGGNTCYQNY